jgi:hypothetical protein
MSIYLIDHWLSTLVVFGSGGGGDDDNHDHDENDDDSRLVVYCIAPT